MAEQTKQDKAAAARWEAARWAELAADPKAAAAELAELADTLRTAQSAASRNRQRVAACRESVKAAMTHPELAAMVEEYFAVDEAARNVTRRLADAVTDAVLHHTRCSEENAAAVGASVAALLKGQTFETATTKTKGNTWDAAEFVEPDVRVTIDPR